MTCEWSLWYVFVLEPFYVCVGYMYIYYMSLRDVRKCKLFWKGQLLQILTFYFDKFTNIFIFSQN